MKTLFLHIGQHKTGTSSIQTFLRENEELLNNHNFSFFYKNPNGVLMKIGNIGCWIDKEPNSLVLGEGARVNNPDKLAKLLSKECNDNVIASAEDFSWFFKKNEIDNFKKYLERYFDKIVIICYLRRQDLQLVSHYQQASKDKNWGVDYYYWCFEGVGNTALPGYKTHFDCYLDYNQRIGNWADSFGDENVVVRLFDIDKLTNQDVVIDFLHVVGIDYTGVLPKRVNESSGFCRTKCGFIINSETSNRQFGDSLRRGLDNTGKMLPPKKLALDIYSHYIESNKKLNERFKVTESQSLFNDDFGSYKEYPQDEWDEKTANSALGSIIMHYSDFVGDLKPEELRDLAIKIESENIELAAKLMNMAHILKPNGPYIKKKLDQYNEIVRSNVKKNTP